jgi:asparagine synthase (glutamine-hydrolysing)
MSVRFLALFGDAVSGPKVREGAHRNRDLASWNVASDLFVQSGAGLRCHFLPDHAGVILGTLFHRHGAPCEVEALSPEDGHAVLKTRARHLIDRFWGRYVAILRLPDRYFVLRDPSGLLPCYLAEINGAIALASDPQLLFSTGLIHPDIDKSALGRALAFGGLPEEQTSLKGVRRLRPGFCLTSAGAQISIQEYWKPAAFLKADADFSYQAQVDKLRRVTQLCVTGWSKTFRQPLLTVSGGLDSSIVAAVLAQAHPGAVALTLTTKDTLGDERGPSRALAAHLRLELREEQYDLAAIDLGRSATGHLASPAGRVDSLAYDAAIVKVARQIGADAIFSGNGGDNVFYMSRSARPLVDRFLRDGLSPALRETVRDICRVTGASSLQVIKEGLRVWRRKRGGYAWPVDLSLLSPSQISELSLGELDHPWLAMPDRPLPPGQAAHVALIMRMQPSADAYVDRDGIPVIHPLFSQPIIETCLSIPTWYQCAGGYDRSVARHAFADVLPKAIVERRGKGSPQGFVFEIFHRFREEIRQRLFDGFLVREAILDRVQIERLFSLGSQISADQVLRLLLMVDNEAWIQNWKSMACGS